MLRVDWRGSTCGHFFLPSTTKCLASHVAPVVKNPPAMQETQRWEFDSWVGTIPWSGRWQPTPVFLPGQFHGQRTLKGYSSWGCKESDMTEQAHTKFNQKPGSASEMSVLLYSSVSLQYHAGLIIIDLEYVLLTVDSVFSYYTFLKCLFLSNLRIYKFTSSHTHEIPWSFDEKLY